MTARHLIRILAAFALLMMPLAMVGQGHAAASASHHAAADADADADAHCQDMAAVPAEEGDERQNGLAQCMMACAALPGWQAPLLAAAPAPRPSVFAGRASPISGLAPEAETPPPRTA
jgi:hypothetical protein